MAPTDKFEELSLSDLSLEPLPDPGLLNYQPTKIPEEKAKLQGDIRNKKVSDRRTNAERRKELRFGADRRSGKERRPSKTWDPGKNM